MDRATAVAAFEGLRRRCKVTVADASVLMLGVTRMAYYKWLEDSSRMTDANYMRLLLALKALVLCYRSGTLPVVQLKGSQRRRATLQAITAEVKKI